MAEEPLTEAILSGDQEPTETIAAIPDDVLIVPAVEDDEDKPFPVPDYVCCAVTEGVWTWFFCILLIVVLFAVATLK